MLTLTVPQYLGRLAANAATIINARDYGRTIHDLATRRQLIIIGEDMVNAAFDSPVDFPPKEQIEEAETRLFSLAETDKYGQGFLNFSNALTHAIEMANNAYQREGGLSGIASGLKDLDQQDGRPAAVGSHHPRRPPFDGQDRARHQYRLQRRPRPCTLPQPAHRPQARRSGPRRRGGRLLLARDVGRAARHAHPLRAGRHPVREDPPRHDRRAGVQAPGGGEPGDGHPARSSSTRPAASRSASSPPEPAGSSGSMGSA